MRQQLKIFHGVSARRKNIPFDVHPEGQDKINDQRRTHRQKRDIDEPGPDPGGGNAHPLPDGRTHPECLPFDEMLQSVHTANLKKNDNPPSIILPH
jgi:hypothetical protein